MSDVCYIESSPKLSRYQRSYTLNFAICFVGQMCPEFVHKSDVAMAATDNDTARIITMLTELMNNVSETRRAATTNEQKLIQSQTILSENQRFVMDAHTTLVETMNKVIANQQTIKGNQSTIIANQNTIISYLKMLSGNE